MKWTADASSMWPCRSVHSLHTMQTHRDGDEVGMEPSEVLRTKDLAVEEPRPMDEELAGYAWLPRMIDKARAYEAGTLGDLMHPCPVDRNALRLLGVEPVTFREIACSAQIAGDVLAGFAGALMASGLHPHDAGSLAAFLHGAASVRANRGGPVTASDVASALPATVTAFLDGTLDDVFVTTKGGIGNVGLSSAVRAGNKITFTFASPVAGGSAPGKGDSSFFFGVVSNYPKHNVTASAPNNIGAPLMLNAWAPNHP